MQIEAAKQQTGERNQLLKRAAWHAFKLFAILRVGTLAWMVLLFFLGGRVITEPNVLCRSGDLLESNLNIGGTLGAWLRWDTICYLLIAETGYTVHAGLTVWPPIYPLLIRLFSFFAAPPILAALIISSTTTWLAFLLLYIFTAQDHDEATARNTLALYTMYPLAFFLVAGYTESLFLALVVGSLMLARKKNWIGAGLLAALATLTRNQGIVLAVVLFWEAFLQYRTQQNVKLAEVLKMLTAAELPIIAFGGFALYVHDVLHADWPWQTLASIWGQYTGWPWEGIIGNVKQLLTLPVSKDLYWLPTNIVDLFLAITIPIVLIVHRRSMRLTYLLFAGLIMLLGLIKVGPDHTLVSFSRYVIPVFPFFVVSSPVVKNRFSRLAVLTICLILQIIFLSMFYVWSWAG